MPWLKTRLRELGKTPTDLARALGIAPPRVHEMIGGRRAIQPNEIAPMARFIGWSCDDLLKKLPPDARVMPAPIGGDLPGPNGPELLGALIELRKLIEQFGPKRYNWAHGATLEGVRFVIEDVVDPAIERGRKALLRKR